MARRIVWITFVPLFRTATGAITSNAASARYRILLPAMNLDAEKWHRDILPLTPGQELNPQAVATLGAADIVVFSKSFDGANEKLTQQLQAQGKKVVFDVCDHHFDRVQGGEHYRRMAALANLVTCNTTAMAAIAQPYASHPCKVIEDPVEGLRQPVRFTPGEPLKLLWFGHPSNLDSLNAAVPSILRASERTKLHMTLLTQLSQELLEDYAQVERVANGRITITCAPWSLEAQAQAFKNTDAVIIPSLTTDVKRVKSSNRMVESLQAGRIVVAGRVPTYEAFSPWAYVGDDMEEGIAWLSQEKARIPGLIEQAQQFIAERYAPSVIAKQWSEVLENL